VAAAVLWIRRASRRQARLPFRTPSALTHRNPFALVRVALSPHTSTTHTHPSIHPSTLPPIHPYTHPPIGPQLSRAKTAARKKPSHRDISRRCHVSRRCRPPPPPLSPVVHSLRIRHLLLLRDVCRNHYVGVTHGTRERKMLEVVVVAMMVAAADKPTSF